MNITKMCYVVILINYQRVYGGLQSLSGSVVEAPSQAFLETLQVCMVMCFAPVVLHV